MHTHTSAAEPSSTLSFYRHALEVLRAIEVPFLVGGAYALGQYTGIHRDTKDFDIFVRRADVEHALAAFRAVGYRAEIAFSHWLAKAYRDGDLIDIIFNSGNGLCPVSDSWFEHAVECSFLNLRILLMPAEEMIWQKAYLMERERFDGADVIHLIRACGPRLDWDRLLLRFGGNWRVLLSHLILFGFVYPRDQDSIPARVINQMLQRVEQEMADSDDRPAFQGTLLSRIQYEADCAQPDFCDPRLQPRGMMTPHEIQVWTDAAR